MLTRSEPFFDDFNDTNYTGWTVGSGTWSASNAVLSDTVANAQNDLIWKYDQDADDFEATYRYRATCTGGGLAFWPRHDGPNDIVIVAFDNTGTGFIRQTDASVTTYLDTNGSCPSTQNVWYNVRVVADGANITVWRWEDGDMPEEVLSTSSCTQLTSAQSLFSTGFWQTADIDDIRFTGSNLKTTTSFTYNNANELTSMTMTPGGTTTFTYDDWGRMTQKANGSFTADYAYRYGSMLYNVDSNFPGEGEVTYEYGGDNKRRARATVDSLTHYRWDRGWNVLSESDSDGTLTMTHIRDLAQPVGMVLADLAGSNPSEGAYRLYSQDLLGSACSINDGSVSGLGFYEYEPFGEVRFQSGIESGVLTASFTNKPFDPATHLYFFPRRYYDTNQNRWMVRDLAGSIDGPNEYSYVGNNPTGRFDFLGLSWTDWLPHDTNVTFGLIFGGGVAEVTCCDDCGDKHKAVFKKRCFGLIAGVSAAMHGLDSEGITGDKGCPTAYSGWFREYSIGAGVAGASFEFCDNMQGAGGYVGLGSPVSAAFCKYTLVSDDIVGKCH
ncbi:MAG: hypothetical protein AMXMBFR84_37110 [Candidatus Hydrogenedentota bacterium]